MLLTLEQFRATKKYEPSLEHLGMDGEGYVYADFCVIELGKSGEPYLTIENRGWSNLAWPVLEEILYNEWYLSEARQ
jgi:hypothetical protein